MNVKTLYSFILYGVKKNSFPNIAEIFNRGFAQALAFEGLNEQNITNALSGYEEYEFTKTNSPKVLGNMNDLVDLYKHFILSKGGLKHCDLTEVIMKINRTPQKNIEWAYSIDRLKELLGVKK